jgi:hypothetical protein
LITGQHADVKRYDDTTTKDGVVRRECGVNEGVNPGVEASKKQSVRQKRCAPPLK